MNFTGVDIGGTKCAVVLGNEKGQIIEKIKFPTTGKDETIKNIVSAAKTFKKTDAVGISCGGPLSSKKGVIMSPPNLMGWDNVPITKILKDALGAPAFLQNDADACALAEWKYGAGKGAKNMIFLTFGTGLGAGLILNGRLYTGASDMAGEAGHIRLHKNGPVGYGKSGSFEGFCSGGGIAQLGKTKALELFQQGKTPSFCESEKELQNINAKTIAEYAEKGFDDALSVYKTSAKMLGYGLSVLIDILNPEKIVIGSVFARSEKLFRKEMEKVLKSECLPASLKACKIVPASLGESLGDVAAISVAANGLKLTEEN